MEAVFEVVIGFAKGFTIELEGVAFQQNFSTKVAFKTPVVVFIAVEDDISGSDGFVTAGAESLVIFVAISFVLVCHKLSVWERLFANYTEKAIWVILLPQCLH